MSEPETNPHAAERCPRFLGCNASFCPLSNEGWHLKGEGICYYQINSSKAGAAERFQDDPVFAECKSKLPQTVGKYPDIGRSVEKAAKSGFRGENIRQLAINNIPVNLVFRYRSYHEFE